MPVEAFVHETLRRALSRRPVSKRDLGLTDRVPWRADPDRKAIMQSQRPRQSGYGGLRKAILSRPHWAAHQFTLMPARFTTADHLSNSYCSTTANDSGGLTVMSLRHDAQGGFHIRMQLLHDLRRRARQTEHPPSPPPRTMRPDSRLWTSARCSKPTRPSRISFAYICMTMSLSSARTAAGAGKFMSSTILFSAHDDCGTVCRFRSWREHCPR
jgi:hypothetical protein